MDIVFGFSISFLILLLCIYKNIFIGFPLMGSLLIFMIIAIKRGFSIRDVLKMAYKGGKKSFVVLNIFIIIGVITASWMASGTVPGIVYYGMKFINPKFFLVDAFLINALVSFMLGTSFGTVGTVGVALMIMARGGNINLNLVAGSIIAGSYFGDRCSPMSSSANLVANITETELYENIKNMFKTALIPFIFSVIIYTILSFKHPLSFQGSSIDKEIINAFNISFIVLIPAIVILVLSILKIDVKLSMLLSILSACVIAIAYEYVSVMSLLKYMIFGFKLDGNSILSSIIKGGGIFSMLKASIIIFISCCLAGILEGSQMLKNIYKIFQNTDKRYKLLLATSIVSLIAAAFGGNQSISIVLTGGIMEKVYDEKGLNRCELASDLENTAVVLSPLIPWNISGIIPTTTMQVSSTGFMPYAFYLYLIPLINILYLKLFPKASNSLIKEQVSKLEK